MYVAAQVYQHSVIYGNTGSKKILDPFFKQMLKSHIIKQVP